jgi:hypothetical protein
MRFYRGSHRYYCGVDLHARTMYLSLIDHQATTLVDKNIRCEKAVRVGGANGWDIGAE